MRVEAYWNLHRKMLSVRRPHGKVIGHYDFIMLHNAVFVVQQAGRERVLREKKKNVHAFVRGTLNRAQLKHINPNHPSFGLMREATYNPYKYNSFVDKETLEPLTSASLVLINGRKIMYRH